VIEGGEGEPIGRSRIHTKHDGTTVSHESWKEAPIDWEVSGPCEPCNNTWMEAIEAETRPILTPLIQHQDAELGPPEQEVLARWATLRVLMGELAHPTEKRRVIRPQRYHRFYEAGELPARAQIWIARRNGEGAWPTDYAHKELFIASPESGGPNAYITAFAVGHVAFVFWGHEVEDGAIVRLGEGMKPYLASIWPALQETAWPPPGLLDAHGLDMVVQNLVRTA
jgi:hypothetical protein